MGKVRDKVEDLFVVRRKDTTYKRGFFGIILVFTVVFSMPAYFMYEDYSYAKYKKEYDYVAEVIKAYESENGEYPLGEVINWSKEKNLNKFFTTSSLGKDRELRYIDMSLISELKNKKHTYILDVKSEKIYTSKFVVYKFNRWHYAFY